MKRKYLSFIGILGICLMLTGCCISHDWQEATCTDPKSCSKCEETEGEALGHNWVEATCTEAKKCVVCGETEGVMLSHVWVDATCTEPKTCSLCGEVEGEALGHDLSEATYLQPATCTVCGVTEGTTLQPTASKEEIAELQNRVDAFVETYNTGNQDVIKALANFHATDMNDEDIEMLIQSYNKAFNDEFDYTWCVVSVPMAFYNNTNEGLIEQYTFEDYILATSNAINSYLEVAQEDKEKMTIWGIMLFATMEYVEEIAKGNPTVLDIIPYEEPMAIDGMCVKAHSYGILDVNGELYYAYLLPENKIVDIYPADEEYFNFTNN